MKLRDRIQLALTVLREGLPNIYGFRGYQLQRGLTDFKGDKSKLLESYASWVYACVNIRAKAVAAATFRVYASNIEIERHALIDLLSEVNPIDTRADLFMRTMIYLDLLGDAYWYIARNRLGVPAELWCLPAERVTIIPDKDRIVGGYELRHGDATIRFDADEVVHFKYPSPFSAIYGMSPVLAASVSIDVDTFQREFQRRLYQNYAVPAGVLETDKKLTDETYKRLKEEFRERYGGENVNSVAVLDSGLQFKPTTFSPRDLNWLDSNRVVRDSILAAFGVPASKLGLVEDVNRANAEANDYTFAVNVIEPILRMFDERLTQDLARKFDKSLTVRHDSTIPRDEERAARVAQVRINTGLTTINEERLQQGYEPVEGGDDLLIPVSLQKLSST